MADGAQSNGHGEDDTFEQDLKEMLQDGPSLNDSSSPVQDGLNSMPLPGNLPSSTIPRSYSSPPATTNVPLSPSRNGGSSDTSPTGGAGHYTPGGLLAANSLSKMETLRLWSLNTYKCTRQLLSEKIGKGSRTVDSELESQIEALRDTQRKYANILRLSRALTSHFYHVVQTQRQMSEAFGDLAQKSPELAEEFTYNAETQRTLCKNGETLLSAMNFFTSGVNTLCNKTMEDTIATIKNYEMARVEYDAYRADLEALQLGPRDPATQSRIGEANLNFTRHKEKFDRLRSDVSVKLKFLDENKTKVMQKQLLCFHNAVSAFFSGNSEELEKVCQQFCIKISQPDYHPPSFLEQIGQAMEETK